MRRLRSNSPSLSSVRGKGALQPGVPATSAFRRCKTSSDGIERSTASTAMSAPIESDLTRPSRNSMAALCRVNAIGREQDGAKPGIVRLSPIAPLASRKLRRNAWRPSPGPLRRPRHLRRRGSGSPMTAPNYLPSAVRLYSTRRESPVSSPPICARNRSSSEAVGEPICSTARTASPRADLSLSTSTSSKITQQIHLRNSAALHQSQRACSAQTCRRCRSARPTCASSWICFMPRRKGAGS